MKSPVKSILMLQKGSNMAQSDPKKILLIIHDVPRSFFFPNVGMGVSKFGLWSKNEAPVSDGRV